MQKHWKKILLVAGMICIQICIFLLMSTNGMYIKSTRWSIIILISLQILFFSDLFILGKVIFKEREQESNEYVSKKKEKIEKENEYVKKEILENVKLLKKSIQDDTNLLSDDLSVEQIRQMLDEAIEKYKWAYQTKFCENKVVDAVLLNKMTIAKEKKIPMYIQVILPKMLPIKDLDVVSLFSNLIDNAMEANEQLPETDRFISVTSGTFVNAMYICVENSKLPSQTLNIDHIKTTKKQQHLHGYGIRIVKKIVEQYSGYITVENETNKVKVKLYIKV